MITIFLEYFYWHFTVAPFEVLRIMQNYLKANWHQFLIGQHFATLFSPWHRQNPSDFGTKAQSFSGKILDSITDLYIRLIAACIRLTIILLGLVAEALIFAGFLVLFVAWLAWPVIAVYLIVKGISSLTISNQY